MTVIDYDSSGHVFLVSVLVNGEDGLDRLKAGLNALKADKTIDTFDILVDDFEDFDDLLEDGDSDWGI